jgi:hypothetical protein
LRLAGLAEGMACGKGHMIGPGSLSSLPGRSAMPLVPRIPGCNSSPRRTPSEAAGGGMDCLVGLVLGPNCREVREAEAARNWLIWIHQRPGTKDPSSSK